MSTHLHTRLLTGSATLALALLSAPAMAADAATTTTAADPAPGEIIVTAQRRAEKVTEVPISITVADSAQLEREQVETVGDLSRIAPSLEINSAPGQNTGGGGEIRGIGTQTFSAGAVPSVGIVVDQVSQGNANISNLFDVARVEVLKGPQGTLFGLTTSAGVINITTNKPDFSTLSLRLRTELSGAGVAGSDYGDQVVQGVINIPLAANAALRVSGFSNTRQGPDYDVTTRQYDANDSFGFRGHLLWEPSSALTINLIGDYSKTRVTNGGDFFTFIAADGPNINPVILGATNGFVHLPDNVSGNLASCGVTAAPGNRDYCTASGFVENTTNGGVSLEIDYKAEPFTVTSITAYRGSTDVGYAAASNLFRAEPLELQDHGHRKRRFGRRRCDPRALYSRRAPWAQSGDGRRCAGARLYPLVAARQLRMDFRLPRPLRPRPRRSGDLCAHAQAERCGLWRDCPRQPAARRHVLIRSPELGGEASRWVGGRVRCLAAARANPWGGLGVGGPASPARRPGCKQGPPLSGWRVVQKPAGADTRA